MKLRTNRGSNFTWFGLSCASLPPKATASIILVPFFEFQFKLLFLIELFARLYKHLCELRGDKHHKYVVDKKHAEKNCDRFVGLYSVVRERIDWERERHYVLNDPNPS